MLQSVRILIACMVIVVVYVLSTLGSDVLYAQEITAEQLEQIPPEHQAKAMEQMAKMRAQKNNQNSSKPKKKTRQEEKRRRKT